jgi:hypothetical protein
MASALFMTTATTRLQGVSMVEQGGPGAGVGVHLVAQHAPEQGGKRECSCWCETKTGSTHDRRAGLQVEDLCLQKAWCCADVGMANACNASVFLSRASAPQGIPTYLRPPHPVRRMAEKTSSGCLCATVWSLPGVGKQYQGRCAHPDSPTGGFAAAGQSLAHGPACLVGGSDLGLKPGQSMSQCRSIPQPQLHATLPWLVMALVPQWGPWFRHTPLMLGIAGSG